MKRIVLGENRPCAFGCLYCFVQDDYESIKQSEVTIEEFNNADIIQPACDYDIFLTREWKERLLDFTKYGKIISFATKACISESKANILAEIDQKLKEMGAFLHVGISITTISDAKTIEPFAPEPLKRIESMKLLKERNIATSVIIRPILPTLTKEDIEIIVENSYSE